MSELKTLQPAQEFTLSTGEQITIKPLPFGKLAQAMALASAIFGSASVGYEALTQSPDAAGAVIARVLSEGGENIYKLLGLGLNKPRDWFDTITMQDGIAVTTLFLELNSDVFLQQALPALKESLGKIKVLKGMAG